MRQYQELLRAEIAERVETNHAEKKRLEEVRATIEAESKTGFLAADDNWDGQGIKPSTRMELQSNAKQKALLDRILELLKDVQELQFELTVRNRPDLVAKLGPGRD